MWQLINTGHHCLMPHRERQRVGWVWRQRPALWARSAVRSRNTNAGVFSNHQNPSQKVRKANKLVSKEVSICRNYTCISSLWPPHSSKIYLSVCRKFWFNILKCYNPQRSVDPNKLNTNNKYTMWPPGGAIFQFSLGTSHVISILISFSDEKDWNEVQN